MFQSGLRILLLVLSFIYDDKINIRFIKSFIQNVKINADSPPSILDGSGEFPSLRDAGFLGSEQRALLGKGPGLLQSQSDPEGNGLCTR